MQREEPKKKPPAPLGARLGRGDHPLSSELSFRNRRRGGGREVAMRFRGVEEGGGEKTDQKTFAFRPRLWRNVACPARPSYLAINRYDDWRTG